jgi:hypothetical protein
VAERLFRQGVRRAHVKTTRGLIRKMSRGTVDSFDLLDIGEHAGVRIATPREFLEALRRSSRI